VCINSTCWFLTSAQFRSTGHVIRVNDGRLPKVIFYSELKDGTRSRGGQRKCYKDLFKVNTKWCDMVVVRNDLEALALNTVGWQSCYKSALLQFEANRVLTIETKTAARKTGTHRTADSFLCDVCGQPCASRIISSAHRWTHCPWDPSCRRLTPHNYTCCQLHILAEVTRRSADVLQMFGEAHNHDTPNVLCDSGSSKML